VDVELNSIFDTMGEQEFGELFCTKRSVMKEDQQSIYLRLVLSRR
jgi:hypothetical protein